MTLNLRPMFYSCIDSTARLQRFAPRSVVLVACLITLVACAGVNSGAPPIAHDMPPEQAMATIRSYYSNFPAQSICMEDEELNEYNHHEELAAIDQNHMVVHYYGQRKVPTGPFTESGHSADYRTVFYQAPAKFEKYDGQVDIRFANIFLVTQTNFVVGINYKSDDGKTTFNYRLYPACGKKAPLELASAVLSLSPNAQPK
jgi:hypothetical protein